MDHLRVYLPCILLALVAACARADVSFTYLGSLTSTADLTTYDFGDISMPSDGTLLVVVHAQDNFTGTVSSASLGGGAATVVAVTSSSVTPKGAVARDVSSGLNNVTVTFSRSQDRAVAHCYLLAGHDSLTPYDTDTTSGSGNSNSIVLSSPAGGGAVYCHTHNNTEPVTWTPDIEDYDAVIESVTVFSAGNKVFSGVDNSQTVAWTTAVGNHQFGVTFAPSTGGGGSMLLLNARNNMRAGRSR